MCVLVCACFFGERMKREKLKKGRVVNKWEEGVGALRTRRDVLFHMVNVMGTCPWVVEFFVQAFVWLASFHFIFPRDL